MRSFISGETRAIGRRTGESSVASETRCGCMGYKPDVASEDASEVFARGEG
jgi:hypothetical protein